MAGAWGNLSEFLPEAGRQTKNLVLLVKSTGFKTVSEPLVNYAKPTTYFSLK